MKYKPDAHLIEKKATGITLIQDLRRALKSKVRSYCPGKGEDKVSRPHSVSPMFQGGIVYIPNKKWATNTEKTGLIGFVAAFPKGAPRSADLCFVAGTLIATTRGQIPIEYIKNTDMVLTPFGWKKVIDCGCTGIKEVITNIGLTGTHNHPIYTFDKGFITLDTITHSSKIMRISICDFIKIVCQEKLSLMDSNFITCRDRNRIAIQGDILAAAALGVRNLLCLTGDGIGNGDDPGAKPVFDLDAVSLLDTARRLRDDGLYRSGRKLTGRPHIFLGAVDNPFVPPHDLRPLRLGRKIAAGARFVQTQYCFDVAMLKRYMASVRAEGLHERCHILVGVEPLVSARSARLMRAHVPGVHFTDEVVARLESARDPEDEGVRQCVPRRSRKYGRSRASPAFT